MRPTLKAIVPVTHYLVVLLAAGTSLSACGDIDPIDDGSSDVEQVEQAVTVPNLEVTAGQCNLDRYDDISCWCDTVWVPDHTHSVYSSCRVQKWDGSKFVTVSPIEAVIAPLSFASTRARTPCVPGTYRAWAGGKVLFSGGWSALVGVGFPRALYYTINRCP